MATTLAMNSLAAITAALGVGFASLTGADDLAYDDAELDRLTRAELAQHAWTEFERADRDGDKVLSADEYSALAIIKAELAHLNGFIALDIDGDVRTIAIPVSDQSALSRTEHIRIEAVARHTFYAFAGADGKMDADDFIGLNAAIFAAADRNNNQALTKIELKAYASTQAHLITGA